MLSRILGKLRPSQVTNGIKNAALGASVVQSVDNIASNAAIKRDKESAIIDSVLAEFSASEAADRRKIRELKNVSNAASVLKDVNAEGKPASGGTDNAGYDLRMMELLRKSNRELNDELSGKEIGELAQACYDGKLVSHDLVRASKLWIVAAGKNHLPSILIIGLASIDGFGAIPRDLARARGILSKMAEETGHPWACLAMATLLLKDLVHSQSSLASAASDKSYSGLLDIRTLTPDSRQSPEAKKALEYYLKAAENNVPPAWIGLSNCYAYGIGTLDGEPNLPEAAKWLRTAAVRGDPLAAAAYAAQLQGVSSIASEDAATNENSAASKSGMPVLVEKDPKSAPTFWKLAAEAGHPAAMHNLGVAYIQGRWGDPQADVVGEEVIIEEKNPKLALYWFARAAEAGFFLSVLNATKIMTLGARAEEVAGRFSGITKLFSAAQHGDNGTKDDLKSTNGVSSNEEWGEGDVKPDPEGAMRLLNAMEQRLVTSMELDKEKLNAYLPSLPDFLKENAKTTIQRKIASSEAAIRELARRKEFVRKISTAKTQEELDALHEQDPDNLLEFRFATTEERDKVMGTLGMSSGVPLGQASGHLGMAYGTTTVTAKSVLDLLQAYDPPSSSNTGRKSGSGSSELK